MLFNGKGSTRRARRTAEDRRGKQNPVFLRDPRSFLRVLRDRLCRSRSPYSGTMAARSPENAPDHERAMVPFNPTPIHVPKVLLEAFRCLGLRSVLAFWIWREHRIVVALPLAWFVPVVICTAASPGVIQPGANQRLVQAAHHGDFDAIRAALRARYRGRHDAILVSYAGLPATHARDSQAMEHASSQIVTLNCHPQLSSPWIESLEVEARRKVDGTLHLTYVLKGKLDHLRIPPQVPRHMGERLWEHTCFEVFIAREGKADY